MSVGWSEEELRAAVEAYVDMLAKEAAGVSFVKKHYYQLLANRFGRTEKSFGYRMQNISYIYALAGRRWLTGLRPAAHVGARVGQILERLIAEVEGSYFLPNVAFELSVREQTSVALETKPVGQRNPDKTLTTVTSITRDPAVKAWVLRAAKGQCEHCEQLAPFIGTDGMPYLETHHVRRLADGGSDTVTNTVALCPNCHREAHYGSKNLDFIEVLYNKIPRLVRE